MNDYLSEFADLQEFDPTLAINPDSIEYTGQTRTIYNKTFKTKIKFRLLNGDEYRSEAAGVIPDFDLTHMTINGDTKYFETGSGCFLFSIDGFIRTSFGTAKYKYLFSELDGFSESLDLQSPSVPIELSTTPSDGKYSIYDILAGKQSFVNSMAEMNFCAAKTVTQPYASAYIAWKIRCRTNSNVYYINLEEQSQSYKTNTIYTPSTIYTSFSENVIDGDALSAMSDILSAIENN